MTDLNLSAIPVHVFDDDSLHRSLLSVADYCNQGCQATFTSTGVTISHGNDIIAAGRKAPNAKLWTISLPSTIDFNSNSITTDNIVPVSALYTGSSEPMPMHTVSNVIHHQLNADYVKFCHASFGSPPVSTFVDAIRQGYLGNFPKLTVKMVTANLPITVATSLGHLDLKRQGLNSTKSADINDASNSNRSSVHVVNVPNPTSSKISAVSTRPNAHVDIKSISHQKILVKIYETTNHSDATGRFPVTSFRNNRYILVSTFNGYIHLEPLVNRSASEYLTAFKSTVTFFRDLGHTIDYQRLDNETSGILTRYLKEAGISPQYVPPNNHRANRAERAIRDVKNHLLSTLATTDSQFPLELWDELLPQVELTMNTLRPFKPNPAISAYAGIYGKSYDFLAHPIAPSGTRVVVHESPSQRQSWHPHGVCGFYLGPAMLHYRSYKVFVMATKSIRISDSLDWFPKDLLLPGSQPSTLIYDAIDGLKSIFSQLVNLSLPGTADRNTLMDRSSRIMSSLTDIASLYHPITCITDIDITATGSGLRSDDTNANIHPDTQPVATVIENPVPDLNIQVTLPDIGVADDGGRPQRVSKQLQQSLTYDASHHVDQTQHTDITCTPVPSNHTLDTSDPQSATSASATSDVTCTSTNIAIDGVDGPTIVIAADTSVATRATSASASSTSVQAAASDHNGITTSNGRPKRTKKKAAKYLQNVVGLRIPSAIPICAPDIDTTLPQDFAPSVLPMHSAYMVANLDCDGKPLTYRSAITGPDKLSWRAAESAEFIRLVDDTHTARFISHSLKPSDRTATYYNPVPRVKILNGVKDYRIRGTIGGDRIDYPGDVTAYTADMSTFKLL